MIDQIKKDDVFELEITDLNNLGNGVGRIDGRVVFVRGAVAGDFVRIKIIKVNKSYLVARLEEILHQVILEQASAMYSGNAHRTPSSDACTFCSLREGCPIAAEKYQFG